MIARGEYGGSYMSLTPGHPNVISDAQHQQMVDSLVMFGNLESDANLKSAGISNDWPIGRG